MTIPPAFLDELRARVPLSDIVGRRIRLQRAGREWKAPCPFHSEKTPSFYINDQKAFFHCFGCGAHGDAVGFLMRHDGLAFPEAVEQLAGLAGMEVPKPDPAEHQKYDRLKKLADALEAAARWFEAQLQAPAGRDALAYLKGRGLDDRAIAEFRLGYAPAASDAIRAALAAQGYAEAELEEVGLIRRPEDGRSPYGFFRNRVIFPVADKRGRIIAFGGRILDGDGPKYVNSPEHALFHKGTVLYGLARARAAIAQGDRPVVVEGYMDVIAMQRAGFGGAVAPLGTALTEAQLAELWKAQTDKAALERPPILCFDGDGAGRRAAARAVERVLPLLGPARTVNVAFLPQGDDPDSLIRRGGAGEVQRVLDTASPLVDAIWEFAAADRSLGTPEQRAGLMTDLEGQVGTIADRSVQTLYRTEIRQRFDRLFSPFRRGERRGGRERRGPGPMPAGPRPPAARPGAMLEARILLATMINHPFLFDEWGESFAAFDLPVAWEPLRQAVFEALAGETLDAHRLCVHLRTAGYGPVLDDILGPATTGHAKFVGPATPVEQVRAGWLDVLNRSHRRVLGHELVIARSDPNRGEDGALERICALAERRIGADDGVGGGPEGSAPGESRQDDLALLRAIDRALSLPPRPPRQEDAEAAGEKG